MKKKDLAKTIPSSWLEMEEYRLNAKPYFSGAVEAKMALAKFACEPLIELSQNGKRGIFNGPRFSRVYVNGAAHGLRLISGADIIQADLSYADMIAKWQARSMPEMVLSEGTTLISSYGTVGRMRLCPRRHGTAYWPVLNNVLRVIPDVEKRSNLDTSIRLYLCTQVWCAPHYLVMEPEGGSVLLPTLILQQSHC